jgi:sugar lactone lactonase YvrE
MPSSRIMRIAPNGEASLHADISPLGGSHINDMITSDAGRTYVDCLSYGMTWAEAATLPDRRPSYPFSVDFGAPLEIRDRLALVEPDGTQRIVADDLLGPNGIAISADGSLLMVSEWRGHRVTSFEIQPDGSLANRSLLFEDRERRPDGICFDEEGAVWFASSNTGECVRVDRAGELTDVVRPRRGERVTSCVLGGADRRTLFMLTDRKPEPASGCVEAARVSVPGAGHP